MGVGRAERGSAAQAVGGRDTGVRVQGSGFRVQGSGFRVQGSGFRVQGSGFGCGAQRLHTNLPGRIERAGGRGQPPCGGEGLPPALRLSRIHISKGMYICINEYIYIYI